MALNLTKNKTINLTKSLPAMTKFKVGLAWDAQADLDASAILVDVDGKLVDGMPVYYGNLEAAGIKHSGDARDGDLAGDDETITLDLTQVDARVQKAIISVTSYSETEAVMFGSTSHPVAKLYGEDGKVLIEAKLDEEAAFGTAVKFVEITRTDEGWTYTNLSETVGSSVNGLTDIISLYN